MKFLLFLTIVLIYFLQIDSRIVKAKLESCPGCSLNKLRDVKDFAYEDLPKYENTEFKKIAGALPELVFLNEDDEEIERHPLKSLNRQECNDLIKSRGFERKREKEL